MKGKGRIARNAVILCLIFVLAIAAVTGTGSDSQKEGTAQSTEAENTGAAGVASVLNEYRLAMEQDAEYFISVESKQMDVVAVSAQTEEQTETEEIEKTEEIEETQLTAEEQEWQNYLMADVEDKLNVRADASEDSEIVGRLRRGDLATVLAQENGWFQISSGNVEGYVTSEYCVVGLDALAFAKANCDTIATVTTSKNLRVRSAQSTDSSIVKSVGKGTVLTVDTETETEDGWVAVLVGDTTCYVCADYVEVSLQLGAAVTLAEEKAAEEAEAAETAAAETKSALSATADEVTLLAALIQCEAGGESYTCQVGVGAVVVNRIKSSRFPNNMYDVIYQSGQFGPAMTGKLDRRLKNGVSSTAISAAKEALAGTDTTGGCLYFNSTSCGHSGLTIGNMVFW